MTVPPTARFLIAATVLTAAGAAHANTPERYLSWESKAQRAAAAAPAQPAAQASQNQTSVRYGIPASPYGQVGNPYRQVLTWPTKQQPAATTASIEPLPQPTMSTPPPAVSVAVPRPAPRPQPVAVAPAPQPSMRPAPTPQPAFDDPDEPEIAPRTPVLRPETQPEPPPPQTQAPRPAVASVLAPPAADSGYKIPTSSKYAARIAAARAAQAQQQSMAPIPSSGAQEPPQPSSPAQAATAPRAPVVSQSLASQETDNVFIPGERITDAMTQEPRRYSLHRQYGMQPDRIQVDPNPTGAILETRFDALESEDEGDDGSPDSSNESSGTTP
ncbi:hypothetical protein [Asticcacaulis sp. AC402]|uniref:hypothetical protein n=1 Tax=Asticcacaulis sp. AC402 TaxID=1282361 RepID=UPI0003C3B727|nr:hypothetical protein [Asticcacaulis sp. AC402]ESQ73686.1 hypothetical protein ABAC402_18025 [Asticcacaulis sp. AC402]